MFNRVFDQPEDDGSPLSRSPWAPIFRQVQGEEMRTLSITYESGIELTVKFPPRDEEDDEEADD